MLSIISIKNAFLALICCLYRVAKFICIRHSLLCFCELSHSTQEILQKRCFYLTVFLLLYTFYLHFDLLMIFLSLMNGVP